LATTPNLALFLCVAVGYLIGKIRIGKFQLGGIPGTLFAAIVIGQVGIPVDPNVKGIAFALFIYSLGFVSGPQFFSSLGRKTVDQVHLAIFSSLVVFAVVWGLAHAFDLDKGTAAGLLAGATTESASVGTAGEALANLGLAPEELKKLQANIGVTYAVTYLFGFTLVVFFASTLAPRMMGIDLKQSAKAYEAELGGVNDVLPPGQEEAIRQVLVRVYRITNPEVAGTTVADFEKRFAGKVTVQRLRRLGGLATVAPDLPLAVGDRVALEGRRETLVEAGDFIGEETAYVQGMGFVGETRDVILNNKDLVGSTIRDAVLVIDPNVRRGVYVTKLTRMGRVLELRPLTQLQAGDVLTIYGPAEFVESAARELGYSVERSDQVDYIYLGFGIIVGMLIGKITLHIGNSPVALDTGGGCLVAGLFFGWLRAKRPVFGNLPAATALHMRDFGLAIFIASVGLATGPEAVTLLREKGWLLPLLGVTVVLVSLILSMYYARYVLKMNPAVICGALAGLLTCTAALNAAVNAADSETPVLGYTIPYAIANVALTLLGPVIVLTT
jgi:putative transport protein